MAGTINNQWLVERLLDDLGKLMWSMVWDVANHDRWLLEPEEVHAELCLELVKLVDRYKDLSYIDLKEVCKTSLRNRVRDLASACYLTHRKAEAHITSLDGYPEDGDSEEPSELPVTRADRMYTLEDIRFDLEEYCEGMSEDAKVLVKEVLNPGERTAYFLWLSAQRKQYSCKKGYWTLTITPQIMARSLGWTPSRLRLAWDEISLAVSGKVDFNGGLVA